MNGCVLMIIVG